MNYLKSKKKDKYFQASSIQKKRLLNKEENRTNTGSSLVFTDLETRKQKCLQKVEKTGIISFKCKNQRKQLLNTLGSISLNDTLL